MFSASTHGASAGNCRQTQQAPATAGPAHTNIHGRRGRCIQEERRMQEHDHSRHRPLPDLHTPTFMEGGGVAFKRKDACKNMTTAGTGHCRRRQAKVALNATHSKTFFTGCTLIRCATQRGPLGEALVVASHRPCSSLAASAFCVKPEAHGQRLSDTFEWATHPQVGPVCIQALLPATRNCGSFQPTPSWHATMWEVQGNSNTVLRRRLRFS